MDEKLQEALAQPGITLIVSGSGDYAETNLKVLDHLVNDRELVGAYVTVNKPYRTVKKMLEDGGVATEDLFFVDAITLDSGGDAAESENAMFLESPQHLTDISIVMREVVEKLPEGEKFLLFDSISTLTIYNSMDTVSKFAHFVTGKMRNWDVTGVIISIESKGDEQIISRLKQFADRTVEL